MMVAHGAAWLTLGRILALLALICVFLTFVVPGVPAWLLALAVALLAVAVLVG